jgi:hypothetical protein
MRWIPQNFNDFLALLLIFIIPLIWALQGCGKLTMPTEVNGALIATWVMIVQFYFRKAKEEK